MLTRILFALLLFQAAAPSPEMVEKQKKDAQEKAAETLRRIQPHPSDPTNLQSVLLDIMFAEQKKFMWWTWPEPLQGKVRIEQKRKKDGWFMSGTRYLDVNGRLYSQVLIDPTLRNPTVILIILLRDDDTEYRHVEIEADLTKGEAIQRKVLF